jgi:small GTP-binding protein
MNNNNERMKIIIIGEAGVGKTCILKKFVDNEFNENELTTISLSFATKNMTINNEEIKLEIWDTVGQEKYKALAGVFFKNSDAAILVYDIANLNSFQQLTEYWFSKINEYKESNLILSVAANKSDLYLKEQVKEEDGREFAKKIGAFFKLTSAKNGEGINELFQTITKTYLDKKSDNKNSSSDDKDKSIVINNQNNINNSDKVKEKKNCKCKK